MDRSPDGPKGSLWQRLRRWPMQWRSGWSRYSRDVLLDPAHVAALRRRRDRLDRQTRLATAMLGGTPLASAWAELPAGTGLTGAAWLGHCTVLLRLGGLTVLTDPVLSPKIGLRVGPVMVGPRRLAPWVPPDALPPVDLILITHAHFDHLDKPTLRRLASAGTRVVTAARTGALVPKGFADVTELTWGAAHAAGPVEVRAIRPAHWGARSGWDVHRGYNSYVLSAGGSRVLVAGDTAYTDVFARVAPVDLAVMGVGAYDPWEHAHATPEQAWRMARDAGARRLLPVHHSTFRLSDEPAGEPLRRLWDQARREPGGPEVLPAEVGRVLRLDAVQNPD